MRKSHAAVKNTWREILNGEKWSLKKQCSLAAVYSSVNPSTHECLEGRCSPLGSERTHGFTIRLCSLFNAALMAAAES